MVQTTSQEPSFLQKAKEAFISRPERPTYASLSIELGISPSTIRDAASSGQWVLLREKHQAQIALNKEAEQVVNELLANQPILLSAHNAILIVLQKVAKCASDVDDDRAPSTRAQTLNTISFCLKNITDGCKSLGIQPQRSLEKELEGRKGDWSPQLVQQINIKLGERNQEMAAQVSAALARPAKTKPANADIEPTEMA